MVSEFAKDLVWENRGETFKDELYIFAKQNHRLFRCNGKVDVIITDRPLIMTSVYNHEYGNKENDDWNKALDVIVSETWNLYDNVNFYLNRVKPYNSNGRNETMEKAMEFDKKFKQFLDDKHIHYMQVNGDETARDIIGEYIVDLLDEREKEALEDDYELD